MRGPRKIDGTLQVDPTNVRTIRCYMLGNGSAKDAVYIDFTTTTNGLYHAGASDVTNEHKSTLAGVALEAWTCDADADATDDTEQIIKIQVLGPVTDVNVASSVAIGDKLVATAVAGRLDDTTTTIPSTINEANIEAMLTYTVVGIAYSVEASNKANVYLLNPLGL